MAWIQVDAGIREHDKIYNLADALKITDAHAVGLMVCLWTWAVTAAPDGDVTNFPPRALAKAAGWTKKTEIFFNAICSPSSQFIVQANGRTFFKNWEERAAMLMDALEHVKEQTRKRVQNYRNRKLQKDGVTYGSEPETNSSNADVTPCNGDVTLHNSDAATECNSNVTSCNEECNVTVTTGVTDVTPLPNLTKPNQTKTNGSNVNVTPTSAFSPESEAADAKTDKVPYVKIMELYNSTCTRLRKIKTVDGERKKAVSARFKKYGMDGFTSLFQKANESDFLCGNGQKNWTADFDWLINATNMAKVLEDKYINQPREGGPNGRNPENAGNAFGNASAMDSGRNDGSGQGNISGRSIYDIGIV
jgi:hypothetical protein